MKAQSGSGFSQATHLEGRAEPRASVDVISMKPRQREMSVTNFPGRHFYLSHFLLHYLKGRSEVSFSQRKAQGSSKGSDLLVQGHPTRK
jgi:hypothetical protein